MTVETMIILMMRCFLLGWDKEAFEGESAEALPQMACEADEIIAFPQDVWPSRWAWVKRDRRVAAAVGLNGLDARQLFEKSDILFV